MYVKVGKLFQMATVALAVAGSPQHAQADAIADEKLKLARAFVEVYVPDATLTPLLSDLLVQQINAIKKAKPDTPIDAIRQFSEALVDEMMSRTGELRQRIAVLYAQDFTREELQSLVSFYGSDLGSKFVAHRRDLLERSAKLGIEWGQALAEQSARKVKKRLRQRGVDL